MPSRGLETTFAKYVTESRRGKDQLCGRYNSVPYICKYGNFPSGHPKVYVGADCPIDCLDRKGNKKRNVPPNTKLYNPVLPYKSNSKLIFPLCSACANTMNQGEFTDSDNEPSLVETWVIDRSSRPWYGLRCRGHVLILRI